MKMKTYSSTSRIDDNEDDRMPPAIPRRTAIDNDERKPAVVIPSAAGQNHGEISSNKEGGYPAGGVASAIGAESSTKSCFGSTGEKKHAPVMKKAVSMPGAIAVAGLRPSDAGMRRDDFEELEAGRTEGTSDLLVAAEVAPDEAEIEARVAAQVEKRIMNEAPRADVMLEEKDTEEKQKPPRCRRWLVLLGLLALLLAAIAVVAAVVVSDDEGDESNISTPPPTQPPPDSNTRYTMFQVDWYAVKGSDGLCEDSAPGVVVSCGEGGTIELWGISDFANCTIAGDGEISCTSSVAEDNWWKVLCACRGSSQSAFATTAKAVPDPSVVCSEGGVAGTNLTIGLMCPGQDFDYTQVQCDPKDAEDTLEAEAKTCLAVKQCLQDTCDLSLPQVTATLSESVFTESCLYGV